MFGFKNPFEKPNKVRSAEPAAGDVASQDHDEALEYTPPDTSNLGEPTQEKHYSVQEETPQMEAVDYEPPAVSEGGEAIDSENQEEDERKAA